MGLLLGNLVDGLSGALHNTEALSGGQGVFVAALLEKIDKMFQTLTSISQTFWSSSRMYRNDTYGWSHIEKHAEIDDL